jgi:hypothetical protein
MSDTNSHRQLLVRCDVTNSDDEQSLRFVEYSVYRLWQYMMANKHGIRVDSAAMCLWLPEAEWHAQSDMFQHAGTSESVNRINIAIYDHATSFCNTIQRYVPIAESGRVQELLMRRIPMAARESDDVVMEIDSGIAIVREGLADLVNLGYALTDAEMTTAPGS